MDEERKDSRDEDPAPVKNSDAERVQDAEREGNEGQEKASGEPPGATETTS